MAYPVRLDAMESRPSARPGRGTLFLVKAGFTDPGKRVEELAAKLEPRVARQFLEMVQGIKDEATLARLAELLEQGRVNEAQALAQAHVERFASQVSRLHVVAGEATEAFLASKGFLTNFNAVNTRAVLEMQTNRTRLIRQITEDQREAIRAALSEGVTRGLNPRAQARLFRDSIGLTSQQVQAVANYRRQLEQGSMEALDRALRDRRFDGTVTRAAQGLRPPLTRVEVDRMTERYRQKWLRFRTETIARTESLGAASSGNHEMYLQAIENGTLDQQLLEREWNVKIDGREREWHHTMSGQKRAFGESFVSGQGNFLRYPHDMNAPASETIRCRCMETVRFKAVA